MPKLFRFTLLLLPLAFLAACDSSDDDELRVGVTGRWVGELENLQESEVYPVELDIVDTRNFISGTGVVQLPTEALAFDVADGLYAAPELRLELRFDRPPFLGSLSGQVNNEVTEIRNGTFSGPGLANGEVMLRLERAN